MENKEKKYEDSLPTPEAEAVKAHGKRERNCRSKAVNKLWLWLGVLLLIFILLWWLYSIGTFEALSGVTNG